MIDTRKSRDTEAFPRGFSEKDEAPSEATNREKRTSYKVRRPCLLVRVFLGCLILFR